MNQIYYIGIFFSVASGLIGIITYIIAFRIHKKFLLFTLIIFVLSITFTISIYRKENKSNYLDKETINTLYSKKDERPREDTSLVAKKQNEKWGFVDKKNNLIIPYKYDSLGILNTGVFVQGISFAKLDNQWGYISQHGTELTPFIFEEEPGFFSDNRSYIRIKGKRGYFDKSFKLVIPNIYEDAGSFSEGLAPVKDNNKYGFIDTNGILRINFKYDDIFEGFVRGRAQVSLNGIYIYINSKGDSVGLSNKIFHFF